jgi:hypothetical protein
MTERKFYIMALQISGSFPPDILWGHTKQQTTYTVNLMK